MPTPPLHPLRFWRERARALKKQLLAVFLASRHPNTPMAAKLLAIAVVAYALSPIDLIPDFIPVLGYLDDLVIVPLGIYLVIKAIPPPVWAECQEKAARGAQIATRTKWIAFGVIVVIWLAFAFWLLRLLVLEPLKAPA